MRMTTLKIEHGKCQCPNCKHRRRKMTDRDAFLSKVDFYTKHPNACPAYSTDDSAWHARSVAREKLRSADKKETIPLTFVIAAFFFLVWAPIMALFWMSEPQTPLGHVQAKRQAEAASEASKAADDGVVIMPNYAVPKGGLRGTPIGPGMRGF